MEILKTKNYELFNFKKENREININKVMMLKRKLLEDGRQIMPIICNKKMEIIDGQHRFEALKELNWEITFYIDDTITSIDILSINNTQTNWSLKDYIHYYSMLGNYTFMKLEDIVKKYKEIPLKVILTAISTKYIKEDKIKNGELNFSEEEFEEGIKALDYLQDIINNIKIRIIAPANFLFLVIKTYYLTDIDRNRLYNNIIAKYGTENYGNSDQCAMVIEHWYNFKSKTYRYISNEIKPKR